MNFFLSTFLPAERRSMSCDSCSSCWGGGEQFDCYILPSIHWLYKLTLGWIQTFNNQASFFHFGSINSLLGGIQFASLHSSSKFPCLLRRPWIYLLWCDWQGSEGFCRKGTSISRISNFFLFYGIRLGLIQEWPLRNWRIFSYLSQHSAALFGPLYFLRKKCLFLA